MVNDHTVDCFRYHEVLMKSSNNQNLFLGEIRLPVDQVKIRLEPSSISSRWDFKLSRALGGRVIGRCADHWFGSRLTGAHRRPDSIAASTLSAVSGIWRVGIPIASAMALAGGRKRGFAYSFAAVRGIRFGVLHGVKTVGM